MAKRTRGAQKVFQLARRRGSARIAEPTRTTHRALQAIRNLVMPTKRPGVRSFVAQKFANRLTGSEYFRWVRRLRAQNISDHQSRRIRLRFVARARTISKGSTLIFLWEN